MHRQTHRIHFEDFSGEQFERLAFAFLTRRFPNLEITWYGQLGSDRGRDIVCRSTADRPRIVQCANFARLTFQKAQDDLAKIAAGADGTDADLQLICGGAVSARLRDRIAKETARLGFQSITIWSGPEFEEQLRTHTPDLLQRFFEGVQFPELPAELARTALPQQEPEEAAADWEIRWPGGIADVSMIRRAQPQTTYRWAIAEDLTFINNTDRQISLTITLFIIYGPTHLGVDPRNLPLPEWEQLVEAFGIRVKPQLLFPLNIQPHASAEGHVIFPIRPDGQGRGVGGDIPEQRAHVLEIEDLITHRRITRTASAVRALFSDNHWRATETDLAFPGPRPDPIIV